MLGFPILYFKGMRLMMFQLSGFYCKGFLVEDLGFRVEALFPRSSYIESYFKCLSLYVRVCTDRHNMPI